MLIDWLGTDVIADATSIWNAPAFDNLDAAILSTVAYADIFDYPLTAKEIHRYLVGMAASLGSVTLALSADGLAGCVLACRDGYYTLVDRDSIVDLRLHRARIASQMWPKALHYGRAIAALPFVRMVTLTGALAVDNVESGDDFDYFIVTEPGRLWLSRALIIGLVVKQAARRGEEVCPNYLLSEQALTFEEHNLYTAHELSQMIPLSGERIYHKMRRLNAWTARFLPNAHQIPRAVEVPVDSGHTLRSLAEATLRTPLGEWLEHWEQERKIHKFAQQIEDDATVAFNADHCKGHFNSHAHPIFDAYAQRLHWLREHLC